MLNRKYVVIVPDGAADHPIKIFGGKTIFEAASIPNINALTPNAIQGLCKTVPDTLQPGSDVAMMAVLGYDPVKYYTGRSPIEAVAQGINVTEQDWIFRCNLVTTKNEQMFDHSAGHISSEEGKLFIDLLNKKLGSQNIKFYPGVGYRHLLVLSGYDFSDLKLFPPHDYINTDIENILPKGKNADILINLINESKNIFLNHNINIERRKNGLNEVTSAWFWGHGKKATMDSFISKYNLKGAAITAVDLVKGLALLIGFDFIKVDGATGYFDTNYKAKGLATIEALKKYDIVLVHVEATDEAGHAGEAETKKKALEEIDKHIVGPVFNELKKYPNWRLLLMPDHPTPVGTRGHTNNPIPFIMAGNDIKSNSSEPFGENNAQKTGLFYNNGYKLMGEFIK